MASGSDKVVDAVPVLGDKSDDELIGRATERTTTKAKSDRWNSRDVARKMEFRLTRMELACADSQDTVQELHGDFKELGSEKEELLARVLELETCVGELQGEVRCALNNSNKLYQQNEFLEAMVGALCAQMIDLKAKVAKLEDARADGTK